MAHPAYEKLGNLAEEAIENRALSDVFKSGQEEPIWQELNARDFTEEDINVLRRGYQALRPEAEPKPLGAGFWMW
jgi:lysophospholipase L1-like esterase